jgi:CheY-like chemotaxis protein
MARILIIDDDDRVRWIVHEILERAGHEIIEASNGVEGIKMYRAKPTDLVITDIIMPEKEGMEIISELRAEFPGVKIIAVSGGGEHGEADYLEIAGKLGAQRVLSKPFVFEDLLKAVTEVLAA